MRQQRAGHIIQLLISRGGFWASTGWRVYCSTKFAVEGITEASHDELAPLGIHATMTEPGFFRTDFMDHLSPARTGKQIGDYTDTVGKTRIFAVERNHQQPGDPARLAHSSAPLLVRTLAFDKLSEQRIPRLQISSQKVHTYLGRRS